MSALNFILLASKCHLIELVFPGEQNFDLKSRNSSVFSARVARNVCAVLIFQLSLSY